jgi:ubiquinone biosynthesis O-methyltransferase
MSANRRPVRWLANVLARREAMSSFASECSYVHRSVSGCARHYPDIGCGAGVLCELLARFGAAVVGLDSAETAIGVAALHAAEMGIAIDYRCGSIDVPLEVDERFDVILAMEVVEHVAFSGLFLDRCARLVAPAV